MHYFFLLILSLFTFTASATEHSKNKEIAIDKKNCSQELQENPSAPQQTTPPAASPVDNSSVGGPVEDVPDEDPEDSQEKIPTTQPPIPKWKRALSALITPRTKYTSGLLLAFSMGVGGMHAYYEKLDNELGKQQPRISHRNDTPVTTESAPKEIRPFVQILVNACDETQSELSGVRSKLADLDRPITDFFLMTDSADLTIDEAIAVLSAFQRVFNRYRSGGSTEDYVIKSTDTWLSRRIADFLSLYFNGYEHRVSQNEAEEVARTFGDHLGPQAMVQVLTYFHEHPEAKIRASSGR